MNRRQRDQNRENALRLAVVVAEHAEHPVYPNAVLAGNANESAVRIFTNQLIDNVTLTV